MKKMLTWVGLLLIAGVLSACGTEKAAEKNEELTVVASFYPMYDFTKNIVGEEGTVELLVPAGTDSHDFEPSARDINKIQEADAFVYNDENMEMWVSDVADSLKQENVTMIKATKDLLLLPASDEHEHDHGEEGHHHELDPHVWLAPSLAMKEVEAIRDQLSEVYPEHAAIFSKNAQSYLEKLAALDQQYTEALSQAKQKSFVTQHAAFSYLALEYGLNQVPISGVSAEEEPSPARLAELKHFVETNGIEYIYFEQNAKSTVADTLADEANIKTAILNPLEGLTEKQMKAGEDYLSIMENNLKELRKTTDTENPNEKNLTPEKEKSVYNGYFKDEEVQKRPLSDWAGQWQSVYPYLQDGTFDQVMSYKAKKDPSKTVEEYKQYYETGYQTDVQEIEIKGSTITFVFEDGTEKSAEYQATGYEILKYSAGNRGVRFLFEAKEDTGAFKYIQFSDHGIHPAKSGHFHLYYGNHSQAELLKEMGHWPTYYPKKLSGKTIAQEMLAH
ncbi:zinc ABC transporter substrate-binding protein AdcA [Enterococcus florum]|uniref:Zinc ABC transporter substrate-binding protein AdcA n=1 Tax=Enterococcus florum TaxID=2480627 RepID=A0A4P5PA77_9ENTE|nr:zinc ABC transporter substrate-binding protein AdcA [Enterococcus florum]GCF95015.1 zinc ABC transporter substrate-binding protein AdcA [Enterococcus florum]